MNCSIITSLLLAAVVLSGMWTDPGRVRAADEVVLQASTASSRITLNCTVLDYNGRYLVARTNQGDQRFDAREVVAVRTDRLPAHVRGEELLTAGDTAGATTSLDQAISAEPRLWVRRELLALLIRCALRNSDFATAGQHFQALYESDPETRHLHLIPLLWSNQTVGGISRTTARAWLQEGEVLPRLLGCSLLLFDPEYGQRARDVLKELQRAPGERLRELAWWQQWRLRIHSGEVSQFDIDKWEERAREAESAARPPAWFILAEGYRIRQEFDLAAAAYLRLPLVFRTDHPVTADALAAAAECLDRIGRSDDAERLRSELLADFAHAPVADRLKRQREAASAGTASE